MLLIYSAGLCKIISQMLIWEINMSKIYFVRHGESEWNVADKICGQTDIPLTQRGHEQAVMTGESFVARKIKADITGIPAREEMRLIEQNFGVWEGTSPRNSHEFYEAKKGFVQRFGSGESMFQLAQRIYNLLDELKADSDKTYILVAHNGIARIVSSYFKDMTNDEFAAYGVANCSITEFEF